MTRQWLRRFSVRQRILAMVILLALGVMLPIPFLAAQQNRLLQEQQRVTQEIVAIDHLILLASGHVAASEMALEHYLQGALATPEDAQAEAATAMINLDAARALAGEVGELRSQQVAQIQELRLDLGSHQALIGQLQAAALVEDVDVTPGLDDQALATAAAVRNGLDDVIASREEVLRAAHQALRLSARRRLLVAAGVELGVLIVVLAVASLVSRSITGPIAALGDAAQRLEQGDLDSAGQYHQAISETGQDELAFLAQVLNNMAARLSASYQDLEQRVAERIDDLARRSESMRAVIDVSRATTDILDPELLLRRSVEVIRQRFGLYYVGLFLVDERRQAVVLRAGTGEAGRAMLDSGHQLRFGEGMIGWCVANARPRVSFRAADDVMRVPNPHLPDTVSEAAIPLRVRGRVIGALTVQDDASDAHRHPLADEQANGDSRHRFDSEAVELLQVMADLLAVAIENARLLNEVQVSLDAAQRAYGQMTREGWLRVLQGRIAGIVMGPEGDIDITGAADFARQAALPDGTAGSQVSDLQAAWRTREPVQRDQQLAVPIVARDVVLGAMRLTKDGEAWTEREVALVQTVVEQLGLALDSARLYEDTQILAARERVARDISDHMRATVDWDDLMQTAVTEIGQAVEASRIFVQWAPPETGGMPPETGGMPPDADKTQGGDGADETAGGQHRAGQHRREHVQSRPGDRREML